MRSLSREMPASSAFSFGPGSVEAAEWRQLLLEHRIVGERPGLGLRLQEEVERVDRRHVGHEIDHHFEFPGAVGHHDAGEEIALRILLPVEEMFGRFDAQA